MSFNSHDHELSRLCELSSGVDAALEEIGDFITEAMQTQRDAQSHLHELREAATTDAHSLALSVFDSGAVVLTSGQMALAQSAVKTLARAEMIARSVRLLDDVIEQANEEYDALVNKSAELDKQLEDAGAKAHANLFAEADVLARIFGDAAPEEDLIVFVVSHDPHPQT